MTSKKELKTAVGVSDVAVDAAGVAGVAVAVDAAGVAVAFDAAGVAGFGGAVDFK